MKGIKIGDWVTQYSKGFWQIVDIKNKYAEEDHSCGEVNYKKGDPIGYWVLMKKAFTPQMKFRLASDYCDSAWCKHVTPETSEQITQYFNTHPKDFLKFQNYQFVAKPAITTNWLSLTEEEAAKLQKVIKTLPEKFTRKQGRTALEQSGLLTYFSQKVPAQYNYIFQTENLLWEMDENHDLLYYNPRLDRVK